MIRVITCMFFLSAVMVGCTEPEEPMKDPISFDDDMTTPDPPDMFTPPDMPPPPTNNMNNPPDPPDTYEFPVASGVDTTLMLSAITDEDAVKICLHETEFFDISIIASSASLRAACYQEGHRSVGTDPEYEMACQTGYDSCASETGVTVDAAAVMTARMEQETRCATAKANPECTSTVEQFEACFRERFVAQRMINENASCDKQWAIDLTMPPILDACTIFRMNCRDPYNL